ncbi:MAG: pyridoxine 5'-phosphate synthase [Planctomycetes bacterium]|nr:pyridoxine 5'-phosphate synthase [Planctomycetota bacterium]
MKLGVNVDHIATIRQARYRSGSFEAGLVPEPDPVHAALLAEMGGADSIVIHLREDRRHIQERDLRVLKQVVTTKLNLEMALVDEVAKIAVDVKPHQVTFVPERREEVTTEGGLDIVKERKRVEEFTKLFKKNNIIVSVFIAPDREQLQTAKLLGVNMVELHTGEYANAAAAEGAYKDSERKRIAYHKLGEAAITARNMRLGVAAGHGLTYANVADIVRIMEIEELNIGHSIVARACFTGMERAVKEMKELLNKKV